MFAWVVMPEHIPYCFARRRSVAARILAYIKTSVMRRVLPRWKELSAPILQRLVRPDGAYRFWQRGRLRPEHPRRTSVHEDDSLHPPQSCRARSREEARGLALVERVSGPRRHERHRSSRRGVDRRCPGCRMNGGTPSAGCRVTGRRRLALLGAVVGIHVTIKGRAGHARPHDLAEKPQSMARRGFAPQTNKAGAGSAFPHRLVVVSLCPLKVD